MVMLRLLRCRFWKSESERGPPGGSPPSTCGGVSILMTLAPQSASWRTQVGPERTLVRSSTVNRSSAREALGNGIPRNPCKACRPAGHRRRLFPLSCRPCLPSSAGAATGRLAAPRALLYRFDERFGTQSMAHPLVSLVYIAAAILLLAQAPSVAQTRNTVAEIAGYTGPERLQRLIDGAKKEGVVSVYG